MGATLGKLFVNPAALPGGELCGTGGASNATALGLVLTGLGNSSGVPADGIECDNKVYGDVQVIFLMLVYGYILSFASNMISDGSELLLLVPSLRGIVGSVVLPILGAVPDGAIVLFSGLGDDAQNQVAVGVGALAGSTIMLLTIPWSLAILGGRVDMVGGKPVYKKPRGAPDSWRRLAPAKGPTCSRIGHFLYSTGVQCSDKQALTGKIMLATSLIYLIIQGPAFSAMAHDKHPHKHLKRESKEEHDWAVAGLVLGVISFVAYLYYQVRYADTDDKTFFAIQKALADHMISLSGVFGPEIQALLKDGDEEALLRGVNPKLDQCTRAYFTKFDRNKDGHMDADELKLLCGELNEKMTKGQFEAFMVDLDADGNGVIEYSEFAQAINRYIVSILRSDSSNGGGGGGGGGSINEGSRAASDLHHSVHRSGGPPAHASHGNNSDDDDSDEEEEEDEMPEEFSQLSPDEQQRAIKMRSFRMMAMGTAIVLLFSDPMVDVLDDLGTRFNIPSFYIAFIMAPLASNASELIAAYNYSLKKTKKTISISFATLLGAAIMNNTFCLSIFLLLIFMKQLAWTFSAETLAILIVEIVMTFYAQRTIHRVVDGFVVLSLFPLSLVFVYVLSHALAQRGLE